MKKEEYAAQSLAALKELAKERKMRGVSTMKKSELVEALAALDTKQEAEKKEKGAAEREPQGTPEREVKSTAGREGKGIAEREPQGTPEREEKNTVAREAKGAAEKNTRRIRVIADNRNSQSGVRRQNTEMYSSRNGTGTTRRNEFTGDAVRNNSRFRDRRGETDGARRQEYGNQPDNRREYGNQLDNRREYGNQPESRREYSGQSDNRREYGSQPDNRREYGSQPDNRREYGNQPESRREYSGQSDNRREYGSQPDNRREYGSQPDNRREYGNQQEVRRERIDTDSRQTTAEPYRSVAGSVSDLRGEDRPTQDLSSLDSGQEACGILEVMTEGYGFIRSDNFMPGDGDVYVSPSQIRRFGLRTGDIISGNTRIKTMQEKYSALLYLKTINGMAPSEAMKRSKFEDMTPVFPDERLRMERGSSSVAMRIVDLFSPIGKGQRGMIVSPPKAGKTTLLKDVAHSILENDPNMQLIILLIDERPEEVTDIKEAICGDNVEVIYSTFDEQPEHHKRVSEMVIERAKRLVEQKKDVTILLDSITRLARAYNLTVPPSGRTLSGGLDPAALYMPKRFFGAARNMREGGSLTILATALVDTGSKMDDVVYEEFKGTGNMELVLDRKLSERRVFPAIDIPKSGTRREDLLLDREEQEAVYIMRRALNGMKSEDAVENILNMFVHTKTNQELVAQVRRQRFV